MSPRYGRIGLTSLVYRIRDITNRDEPTRAPDRRTKVIRSRRVRPARGDKQLGYLSRQLPTRGGVMGHPSVIADGRLFGDTSNMHSIGERGHSQVTFSPRRYAPRLLLPQPPTRGHEHPDAQLSGTLSEFSRHPQDRKS